MNPQPSANAGRDSAPSRPPVRCLLTEVCPHQLKQILVPIDFSDCSRDALRYAVPTAERFGAELLLLYVIETPALPSELGDAPADMRRPRRKSAELALEELARRTERALGIRFGRRILVRNGIPWQEITANALALDVDLILLATHGYTGLQHIFLGSTAERVVRHAPCPVLVVRERAQRPPSGATFTHPAETQPLSTAGFRKLNRPPARAVQPQHPEHERNASC